MINNMGINDVKLTDGFWKKRFDLNAEVSVYAVKKVFEESGRFNALRFVEGNKNIHFYYDSDVAKWMEAVAYLLAHDRKKYADLEDFCDELIDSISEHQREDGYYNSYFLQIAPEKIFTDRNLHELYCMGHLIEAAIAYDKYTGKSKFLELAKKMVECIKKVFILDKSAPFTTGGHEEIELALFALYEHTKNEEYKQIAEFFINERGNNELDKNNVIVTTYNIQDNAPARELVSADGHAVRATYYYCGMADMARISNDEGLKKACLTLFDDIVNRKMFITGGIGSARWGETFTSAYDLPNLTAYSESCAAIGLVFFCYRLQLLGIDGRYSDVIERVLYNGFLSSTSLDGKSFFYENPLEVCRKEKGKEVSTPDNLKIVLPIWRRQEVFSCSCCPPNINRFVSSIEKLIYSATDEGVYVNQFMGSELSGYGLSLKTKYPEDGKVEIIGKGYKYKKLFVRIPAWCGKYALSVDGKEIEPQLRKGYAELDVDKDFTVKLEMEMKPTFMEANPRVRDDAGKVCMTYGPVVYCIEEVDNGADLFSISADTSGKDLYAIKSDEYNGLPVIYGNGERKVVGNDNPLYARSYPTKDVKLRYIPYHAFANREESDMLVWINAKK